MFKNISILNANVTNVKDRETEFRRRNYHGSFDFDKWELKLVFIYIKKRVELRIFPCFKSVKYTYFLSINYFSKAKLMIFNENDDKSSPDAIVTVLQAQQAWITYLLSTTIKQFVSRFLKLFSLFQMRDEKNR